MSKVTIATFQNTTAANNAVEALENQNVDPSQISYLSPGEDGKVVVNNASVGQGAATGAVTGGVIGAIAGLIVANGILPGLGTLFVAGPLATALGLTGAAATTAAGTITGLAAGGLIGALTNMGVSDEDARMYQEEVKNGKTIILVDSENPTVAETISKYDPLKIKVYGV